MKQLIFAISLAIGLILLTIWGEIAITRQCDKLTDHLAQGDTEAFQSDWDTFSKFASFLTPYDLIRTADSNAENYLSLYNANADVSNTDAARKVLESSIKDIRRIHDLSWELIF